MKKVILIAFFLTSGILTFAQQPKRVLSPQMRTIVMARQLADYGYTNKDAMALANAAKIIAKNTKGTMETTEKEADKTESNMQAATVPASQGVAKTAQTSIEPAKLIRDAKMYAGSNATLVAAVTEIENEIKAGATKGLSDGPTTKSYKIDAYSTRTLYGTFSGGSLARLIVSGDGDTDLDIYVYDEYGNLADSDSDNTDYCVAEWTPRRNGQFKIVIKNRGRVYNNCVLMTN